MGSYCNHCGLELPPRVEVCPRCERPRAGAVAGAAGSGAPAVAYAGFWLRVGAALIDGMVMTGGIIVSVAIVVFAAISLGPRGQSSSEDEFAAVLVLVYFFFGFVVPWLYQAWMESSRHEATLGKKAVGIRVVDLDGRRISFGRATGRHFGKLLSAILFDIGFLMAGFTKRKQALHDLIAGTLVARAR
jgi:uncharacterized RDD family membrane protein YckC